MNTKLKFAMVDVLAACATLAGFAVEEAQWDPNGSGGWGDTARWVGMKVPTDGMGVRISSAATVNDVDAEIVGRAFAYIVLQGNAAKLNVSNATAHVTLRSEIMGEGTVVKKGAGLLSIEKLATDKGNSSNLGSALQGLVIEDGVVELTAPAPLTYAYYVHCPVTVNAPGILSLYPETGTYLKNRLWGDGIVSNATTQAISASGSDLRFCGGSRANPGMFSGYGVGNIRIYADGGYQQLTDGDWTKSRYEPIVAGSAENPAYLGMWSMPSFVIFRHDGEYESLTTDGSTQRGGFWVNNTTRHIKINAGPVGGQLFDYRDENGEDEYRINLTEANAAYLVELDGTNTSPASLGLDFSWSHDSGTARLKKLGTGTWNLVGTHKVRGVVAVERGTLNYDTLAEAGSECSLGTAARPQSEYYGAYDASKGVNYTCLIGDGVTDYGGDFLATLNYNGTAAATIVNRPVAIDKAGVFSSDTSMSWSGFTPYKAEATTLVLAGSGENNVAHAVTNGIGTLSVVKEGAGSWKVAGDFDFSGGAYAKGGTLELDTTTAYSYYKLTLQDNGYDWSKKGDGGTIWLAQIALIDEDGANAALNLSYNKSADGNPAVLEMGQAAFARTGFKYLNAKYALTNLFTDVMDEHVCAGNFNGRPHLYDESTWVAFVMRPNAGFKAIEKYDIRHWAKRTVSDEQMWSREPITWKMEGSYDGINWTQLHAVVTNDSPNVNDEYNWETTDSRTYDGFDIASGGASFVRPEALANVGAAAGATLKVTGNALKANGLVYDAAQGAGTLRGFSFGATGTLEIRNAPARTGIAFKYAFADCTGVENLANWTLTINGKPSTRAICVAADGTVTIPRNGLMLICR